MQAIILVIFFGMKQATFEGREFVQGILGIGINKFACELLVMELS
jgi:hypothetical protein